MNAFRFRLSWGGRPVEGLSLQRVDAAFLFEYGSVIRALRNINKDTTFGQSFFILDSATEAITAVCTQSIYAHLFRPPVHTAAGRLVKHISSMDDRITKSEDWNAKFTDYEVNALQQLYLKFETLFLGDLQSGANYLVSPKGGFDTGTLIEAGRQLFTAELTEKVPDAISDLEQATRCIAYELPTAAGFHLHRGHESVLRTYWDCVTGGQPRPRENNMGVYLRELDNLDRGRPEVRSHLRSIKDFHRNPLMHPEQSLESVDQALDLLAAIRCSIGYMLQEIPSATPLLEEMAAQ